MVVSLKCWGSRLWWLVYGWDCGKNPRKWSPENKIPGWKKKNRKMMFASFEFFCISSFPSVVFIWWNEHNERALVPHGGVFSVCCYFEFDRILGLVCFFSLFGFVWVCLGILGLVCFFSLFLRTNQRNKQCVFFIDFSSESTTRSHRYPKMFNTCPTISHTPICEKWTERNKPRLFFSVCLFLSDFFFGINT